MLPALSHLFQWLNLAVVPLRALDHSYKGWEDFGTSASSHNKLQLWELVATWDLQ